MRKVLANHWPAVIRSVFAGLGAFFLPVEAYEVVTDGNLKLSLAAFLAIIPVCGVVYFILDGHLFSGFLKKSVDISSNSFDTRISVKFGDLFEEKGWKAIGVNDFFDSQVDDIVIAKSTLHGHAISSFWVDNVADWEKQIRASLDGVAFEKTKRIKGNKKRYPIGTTAAAVADGQKLLFAALGETEKDTYKTSATAESLICAVRGMLSKARIVCANEPLFIPLMGSGLGRVGSKHAIMVDLILVAIFEETKVSKVTDSITIVLAEDKSSNINLAAISRDWK